MMRQELKNETLQYQFTAYKLTFPEGPFDLFEHRRNISFEIILMIQFQIMVPDFAWHQVFKFISTELRSVKTDAKVVRSIYRFSEVHLPRLRLNH